MRKSVYMILILKYRLIPQELFLACDIERGFLYKHVLHFRLGYNWIRHGDQGVHEDERGDGFGFSLGYKYYLKKRFRDLFFGSSQ